MAGGCQLSRFFYEIGMAGEEVWLVDINKQCVEVFSKPTADGYQNVQKFRRGESLAIQAFGDVKIFVDEILG